MLYKGIKENFIEELFKPSRHFDEKKIEELNKLRKKGYPKIDLINIKYSKKIDTETIRYLKTLTKALVIFAYEKGFKLRNYDHIINFIDIDTYQIEIGSLNSRKIPLPASKLNSINSKIYEIIIILPKEINTNEVKINLSRSLLSKLFGELHFKENILPLEFYQKQISDLKYLQNYIPGILEMIKDDIYSSERFESYLLNKIKSKQSFTGIIINKWYKKALNSNENKLMQLIYKDLINHLKNDPKDLYIKLINKIKKVDSNIKLILPHEKNNYLKFEKKNKVQFFRAYANRLEEILALIGFLEELELQVKKIDQLHNLKQILLFFIIQQQ